MVVSDHGMTRTPEEITTRIAIEKLLEADDIDVMLNSGAFSMLFPKPSKIEKVTSWPFYSLVTDGSLHLARPNHELCTV